MEFTATEKKVTETWSGPLGEGPRSLATANGYVELSFAGRGRKKAGKNSGSVQWFIHRLDDGDSGQGG